MASVRLTNVVVIRPILVVLLVFYHSFAIYGGSWEPIEGFPEIKAYWWLDWLSYAFMLEMFVFVSGYTFGYQVRVKGESKLAAKSLFWAKFKRLMIPSILFSLLYMALFTGFNQPIQNIVYDVVIGYAHMWFLPMLFLCFVGVWIIEKFKLKPQVVFPILLVVSLLSVNGLPFQLSTTMYYMLFFYWGYYLQRNSVQLDQYYKKKNVVLVVLSFVFLFFSLRLLRENLDDIFDQPIQTLQLLKFIVGKYCQLIYASTGIFMVIIVVGYYQKDKSKEQPVWLIEVGYLCFGVYLLQQFILYALYYYTSLPFYYGPYLLPWAGFGLALIISVAGSWFIRKTNVGRFLIG